jgi:hypothetical protein
MFLGTLSTSTNHTRTAWNRTLRALAEASCCNHLVTADPRRWLFYGTQRWHVCVSPRNPETLNGICHHGQRWSPYCSAYRHADSLQSTHLITAECLSPLGSPRLSSASGGRLIDLKRELAPRLGVTVNVNSVITFRKLLSLSVSTWRLYCGSPNLL